VDGRNCLNLRKAETENWSFLLLKIVFQHPVNKVSRPVGAARSGRHLIIISRMVFPPIPFAGYGLFAIKRRRFYHYLASQA